MRLFRLTLLGLLLLPPGLLCGQTEAPSRMRASAPVQNYAVSFFSDDGFPFVRVQGSTADISDPSHVKLGEMVLTLFTGTADRKVDAVLMAPVAVLEAEAKQVTGPAAVRVIGDDLEVSGEDWSYEKQDRRIHIRRQARIVFNASLPDLLK